MFPCLPGSRPETREAAPWAAAREDVGLPLPCGDAPGGWAPLAASWSQKEQHR